MASPRTRNEKNTGADALTKNIEQAQEVKYDVMTQASIDFNKAETRRKELLKEYRAEEKVDCYLPPSYQAHFGKVMQVMINGIAIAFKVDGSKQKVPQSFADEIETRRLNVDAIENKKNAMANVQSMVDDFTPGSLELF